jgi:hypothetical protein
MAHSLDLRQRIVDARQTGKFSVRRIAHPIVSAKGKLTRATFNSALAKSASALPHLCEELRVYIVFAF